MRCGANPPFRTTSEDLYRPGLQHLGVIDFNAHPVVPGRGSGIFLHAATDATLGCVSLHSRARELLRWLDPEARPLIDIGTRATIREF